MGSPGVFIHPGTLGGRLSELSLAASTSLPARALAITPPPSKAPPSRRNRRRDVGTISSSILVGLTISRPRSEGSTYKRASTDARLTFNLMVPRDAQTYVA